MPDTLIAELLPLMPFTVSVQPGAHDAFGDWVPSGAAVGHPCQIEGQQRLVRDLQGQEVVSSMQIIMGGAFGLSVDGHRYTLPSGFVPSGAIKAIGINRASDENGAHHEVVMLP